MTRGTQPAAIGEPPLWTSHPPFSWASWLLSRADGSALAAVLVIAVLRCGVGWTSIPQQDIFLAHAASFPDPGATYSGLSVLSPAVAHLAHADTHARWFLFHAAVTLIAIGVLVWLTYRRFDERDERLLVLATVAASGVTAGMLQQVGFYDIWVILAAILLVLPRGLAPSIAAGLLLGATNSEQGVLALLAFVLCALALDRRMLARAGVAFAALVAARFGVHLWYQLSDVSEVTRAGELGPHLRDSFMNFAGAWPVQVYAWFSAAWILVLGAIGRVRGKDRLLLVTGLVLIPAIGSMITLDGTRVFVCLSTPALLLLAVWAAGRLAETGEVRSHLVGLVTLMLVTPGVTVGAFGTVNLPWEQITVAITTHVGL